MTNFMYYCQSGQFNLPSLQVPIDKVNANVPAGTYYGCTYDLRYGYNLTFRLYHPYSSECTSYQRTKTQLSFCNALFAQAAPATPHLNKSQAPAHLPLRKLIQTFSTQESYAQQRAQSQVAPFTPNGTQAA